MSRFNHLVSVRLLEGCHERLLERGARPEDIHVAWVPGAFEMPQAARVLAASGRYDAIVTLGVVIRGGTPHFEYVCRGVTDGVREVMRDTGVPVAFGVLTTDDLEQALARAGGAHGNKGAEAALAAIEMARLAPRCAARRRRRRGAAARRGRDGRDEARSASRHQSRRAALQVLYAVDVATGARERLADASRRPSRTWPRTSTCPTARAPSPRSWSLGVSAHRDALDARIIARMRAQLAARAHGGGRPQRAAARGLRARARRHAAPP